MEQSNTGVKIALIGGKTPKPKTIAEILYKMGKVANVKPANRNFGKVQ